ncbi:hypothetical protein G3492_22775 [Shewanella baltica]|nr:hypothetical protein [Shewanella baltica]
MGQSSKTLIYLDRKAVLILYKTTACPMAAFWHPCHHGICESFHIRRAIEHPRMDQLRVGEKVPWQA